ncbi:MAG: YbjN domain-containing protein [Actinomycetota bacterium]
MTRLEILQPFVEKTVGHYLGTTEVTVWEDGTIPIRSGSTIVNVRLLEGEDGSRPVLQVYCPMLSEIDASPELLTKLNEVNADLTFVRAFWVDRQVILAMELLAESLDRDQVAHAVSLVSLAGNFWDSELNSTFGGRTYFGEEPVTASGPVAATPPPPPPGVEPSLPPQATPTADRTGDDPPAAGYI